MAEGSKEGGLGSAKPAKWGDPSRFAQHVERRLRWQSHVSFPRIRPVRTVRSALLSCKIGRSSVISNRLLRSLPEPVDLVQTLQRSNPGLRLSGNSQNIDVNGLPGRSVVLTGASPIQWGGEALRERDWLVTVPRRAVYFIWSSSRRTETFLSCGPRPSECR
jgi:hypothetical protein